MTPAAFHRISRPGSRARRVAISSVLQVAGMTVLLASMAAALFVVVRFLYESTALGLGVALLAAVVGAVLWFGLALARNGDS
jgi:hypothetical protein